MSFTLPLKDIHSKISTMISVVAVSAELISIKLNKKKQSIDFYIQDKEKDLDIYASFIDSIEVSKTKYFTVECQRLRSLFSKQSEISISLNDNSLKYKYNNGAHGKIEIAECEEFQIPETNNSSFIKMPEIIFNHLDQVKLASLFKNTEMMLFVRYSIADRMLYMSCADNYHASLLSVKTKDFSSDFDLVLPIKYLDILVKFVKGSTKVSLFIKDANIFFKCDNVTIRLPNVSLEGTNMSMDGILNHFKNLDMTKKKVSVLIEPKDLKLFMDNALSIKEKEKTGELVLTVKDNNLKSFIETKHGTMEQDFKVKTSDKTVLKINCIAIDDFLSKLKRASTLTFTSNSVLFSCELDTETASTIMYTAIGNS